ncbi:MAG TPA: hypothetical protein DDW36_02875 [Candidatus Magasanikbacteria bacterium]|nr:hypothetical protein [Candidatus Magasanikbacteria bacterium]
MSFFSKKPNTTIGVDFGVGGVKLVELKVERGRAHLSTYAVMQGGWADLTDDVALLMGSMRGKDQKHVAEPELKQMGAVLKQLVKKSRALGRSAVASIPASAVFNVVMRMPRVPEKDFVSHARDEATKLLPLPAEEMVLDFQTVGNGAPHKKGEESTNQRVLITATSRILVEEYTKIFQYAGLALSNLETESFALIRALLGRDPAPAFVLDIGTVRTNLFVVSGGIPLIHRSINFGGQNFNTILKNVWGLDDVALIEQAKRDISSGLPGAEFPDRFKPILDPVVQEIKYHLELCERGESNGCVRPEKIVLTGGSVLLLGLTQFLEQTFNITTYIADPWARVIYPQALKPALDAVGVRFAVAIGLAARASGG